MSQRSERKSISLPQDKYEAFLAELSQAARAYHTAEGPSAKRIAWFDMLSAIMTFLTRLPSGKEFELLRPLDHLMTEIKDIEEGKQPRTLSPKLPSSRPRMSTADTRDLAMLSVCVDKFMQAGLTQQQAAEAVVKGARAAGWVYPNRGAKSGRPDWEQLLDYRKRLRSSSDKERRLGEARKIYDLFAQKLADAKGEHGLSSQQVAEQALRDWWPIMTGHKRQKPPL